MFKGGCHASNIIREKRDTREHLRRFHSKNILVPDNVSAELSYAAPSRGNKIINNDYSSNVSSMMEKQTIKLTQNYYYTLPYVIFTPIKLTNESDNKPTIRFYKQEEDMIEKRQDEQLLTKRLLESLNMYINTSVLVPTSKTLNATDIYNSRTLPITPEPNLRKNVQNFTAFVNYMDFTRVIQSVSNYHSNGTSGWRDTISTEFNGTVSRDAGGVVKDKIDDSDDTIEMLGKSAPADDMDNLIPGLFATTLKYPSGVGNSTKESRGRLEDTNKVVGPLSNEEKLVEKYSRNMPAVNFSADLFEEPKLEDNCWAERLKGDPYRFIPNCNPDGTYSGKQCDRHRCWCVNRKGEMVESSNESDLKYHTAGQIIPYGNPYLNIVIRVLFITGSLLSSYWAWNIICSPELFGWSFICVIINLSQLLYSIYKVGPLRVIPEINELYLERFQPLNVDKVIFSKLVDPNVCTIHNMKAGEIYALKRFSLNNKLSILLKGRMTIFDKNLMLYHIFPNEFLDAAEFQSFNGTDDQFQVSLFATKDSMYVCWERKAIEHYFARYPELKNAMNHLMAYDTVAKLNRLNQQVSGKPSHECDVRIRLMSALYLRNDTQSRSSEPVGPTHSLPNDPGTLGSSLRNYFSSLWTTAHAPGDAGIPSSSQHGSKVGDESLEASLGEAEVSDLRKVRDFGQRDVSVVTVADDNDNFTFADLVAVRKRLRMENSVRVALDLPPL